MTIKLYYFYMSPPARAVNLTLNALNLNAEFVNVNFLKREQLTPEFVKVSVLHFCFTLKERNNIKYFKMEHNISTGNLKRIMP